MVTSTGKQAENGQAAMHRPAVVTAEAWEAARRELLVKEKVQSRARDALAAERRRMPWMPVYKSYAFEGPNGKVSLLDLFEGRHQLIVYRAFYEPGVYGWPEHACRGCSMVADQVAHVAHLNARDTTLVFASRAPQADILRVKARMGWDRIPWVTITDGFDFDFGVDEWHGHNVFLRDGEIASSAPISSPTVPTSRWAAPGTISTSRRSAGRRRGRIRPPAIRRPRPINGGTGTTATSPAPSPT